MQLVAENLVLNRGGRTVVDGLSFRLQAGEALVLTGANGTGKTTLLRALAGFLAPASGAVSIDVGGDERAPAECMHFVGHLDGIKTHLTVNENLAFWADYLGGTRDEEGRARIDAALERLGLGGLSDIPAGYLSAGQKRRLALSRVVAVKRPLWLLDEPTVSLDTASVARLVAAIEAHLADGGLAIVATHMTLGLAQARKIRLGAAEAAA